MPFVWSYKVDSILSVGVFLGDFGVSNWALTRSEALNALKELEANQVPVLGGDVYEVQSGVIRPNRDNWYCNRNFNENHSAFVTRSISSARSYITTYQPNHHEIFFVLVPDV